MKEFIDGLLRYWPLVLGGTTCMGFIFALGSVWQETKSHSKVIASLPGLIQTFTSFMEMQKIHNDNSKNEVKKVADALIVHDRDDASKFAELVVRVDQVYNLLVQMKR